MKAGALAIVAAFAVAASFHDDHFVLLLICARFHEPLFRG